jgi:hypothetical protein
MLDLLFTLCTWHALAKLRFHTFSTLQIFKSTTKLLGQKLRHWVKKTCAAFDTQELPKEASARHWRKAAAAAKSGKSKEVPIQGKRGRGRGKGQMPGQSTRKATTQQAELHQLDSETLHSPAPNVSFEASDPLPKTLPEVHYHISNTTRLKDNIFRWVDFHEQNDDDAVKVSAFLPCVPLSSSSLL